MSAGGSTPAAERAGFCPHCGFDLEADEILTLGGLRVDPRGSSSYDGRDLALTIGENIILCTIAKAYPRLAPRLALRERLDFDGDFNTVEVLLHRVRRKLCSAGSVAHIETIRGAGYRLVTGSAA